VNLKWEISDFELSKWQLFIAANKTNDFVLDREKRNISREVVDLSKNILWYVFVGCQVTTQQRSGKNSAVGKFLESKSNALNYEKCANSTDLENLIRFELSNARLRRSNIISNNLFSILTELENGGWEELIKMLKTIEQNTSAIKERKVAKYLSDRFAGIGPKQARNFIQWLGLSRYEIPIDSRILKKMKSIGCSFLPKAGSLNDEMVYLLLQDGLQLLAEKLEVYPCVLDACIFSSFDEKKA